MIIGVDNNYLGLLLHPGAKAPIDPSTNLPLTYVKERLDALVTRWNKGGDRVIVPIPALAEFLVLAGDQGNEYLAELNNLANIYIVPFELRAAIELASIEINARRGGNKRGPLDPSIPWQKIKVDRQIVAIAKISRVNTLYSDDGDVRTLAEEQGITVISTWELPLPARPEDLFSHSREIELE